jgi:hypothetical protein
MYFLSAGEASNPHGRAAVYELVLGSGGGTMPIEEASPSGPPVTAYLDRTEWEQDRYYQAGLLEAPSRWFWDILVSPGSRSFPFRLGEIVEGESKIEVHLQGASDFAAMPDHHVRLFVNGSFAGDAVWDGKTPRTIAASLPPGVLRTGENDLVLENVGDTGASYSMVFLDRFVVTTLRPPVVEGGALEGSFPAAGAVSVSGAGERSIVVQTSPGSLWLRGARTSAGGISFRVEPGRSYLLVTPEGILVPGVTRAATSGLRRSTNRADYLLVAPREFLPAAAPLLERRRRQGLVSRGVSIEEIYDEFGFGEARPESLKQFLEHVYHHWRSPSVRYVVLLGDATYDANDRLGTGVVDRVPSLTVKTSYLFTASDPTYARVNGDDGLPDLAIGRLPAANLEEARDLVEKLLAYEDSKQSVAGPAVIVADDPDAAGDFEADGDEIASWLSGRDVEKIYLRRLRPAATRSAIVAAFDRGPSLVSYVGHGGISVWGSESFFNGKDVTTLSYQPRQPIVMTMNCLNGYFAFPHFDALAEALVKARGKGAIAVFAPSGLSLNFPAHLFHQALVDELHSGRHRRLGDAVLAAQIRYAETGAFPELLSIYHLFGDPALVLR